MSLRLIQFPNMRVGKDDDATVALFGFVRQQVTQPVHLVHAQRAFRTVQTDEKVQAFLMDKFKAVLPEAEFLGEEDGQDVFSSKMASGYCFVIDPIDGTSNFICDYHPSVVSIGLIKDKKPYMGVVCNPYDDMMFEAAAGQGAYMNGERIMSSEGRLSDSLVTFGTDASGEKAITGLTLGRTTTTVDALTYVEAGVKQAAGKELTDEQAAAIAVTLTASPMTAPSDKEISVALGSASLTSSRYGKAEFAIVPDDSVSGYVWSSYWNSIYGATISNGRSLTRQRFITDLKSQQMKQR